MKFISREETGRCAFLLPTLHFSYSASFSFFYIEEDTTVGLGYTWAAGVRFPAGTGIFSPRHRVQTECGTPHNLLSNGYQG